MVDKSKCAICGASLKSVKKHKASDGYICDACFSAAGYSRGQVCFADTVAVIKQFIEDREKYRCVLPTLYVDDLNRMWRYYGSTDILGRPAGTPIDLSFDDVVACSIIEDNAVQTTVKKNGIGRAVVGGMLFGGAGAIVGATTGKSKVTQTPVVRSLKVNVTLKNTTIGEASFPIISTATDTNSNKYLFFRDIADRVAAEFQKMIGTVDGEKSADTIGNPLSDADELRKFKSLLDDGIITQEEFDAKKKQLLNL